MSSVEPAARSSELTTRGKVIARLRDALERTVAGGGSYSDLDVETLAREAGLSRSSFYVYFEGKVDLIRELADDVIASVIEIGRGWWELPPAASKAELHAALEQMLSAYRTEARLVGVFVEAAAYDPMVREKYMSLMRRYRRVIEEHIREGQQRGFVRQSVDPDTTPIWLAWMLSRGAHELIRLSTPAQFKRRLTAFTDIIWGTLYEGTR